MALTIDQILAAPNLTGIIQQTTSGIPDVWDPRFYTTPVPVNGDTGEYTVVNGTRTLARAVMNGSPSVARDMKNVGKQPVKLITTAENFHFNSQTYLNLLNYDNLSIQRLGIAELTRQTVEFKQNFSNLRIAALTSMLFTGHILFDGNGNFLPPGATNSVIDVDYKIPAGNQGQLNVFGTGNLIDTSWDNVAANITTQIARIRKAARRLTGYPIAQAYYGENVIQYIMASTNLQQFLKLNPQSNPDVVLNGEIPKSFAQLSWRPGYEAFFQDQNGVFQDMVGPDQVLFCPDPDASWLGWLEGTTAVPTSVGGITTDAVQSQQNVAVATGMYSYGQIVSDPVTVKQVAGDVFLPVLKVPKCIFIATVKFGGI